MEKSLARLTAALFGFGWLALIAFAACTWWPAAILAAGACAWSVMGWGPLWIALREGFFAPEEDQDGA